MTASTKSTSFSSSGVVRNSPPPPVPTDGPVEIASGPISERKSTPVAQLRISMSSSPPIPSPPSRIPPPVRERTSSTLSRLPAVHFMAGSVAEQVPRCPEGHPSTLGTKAPLPWHPRPGTLLNHNISPLALTEPEDREQTTREVAKDDRRPHARRIEAAKALERGAQPQRHEHLR